MGVCFIIVKRNGMVRIEVIRNLCTGASGIGMPFPQLSGPIFCTSDDGSVRINVVSQLSFAPLGVQVIDFFPEAASTDIDRRCRLVDLSGDDIDDTAFSPAAIRHTSRSFQDLDMIDIIHIIQKRSVHITTVSRALHGGDSHAIDKDDYIRAAIDTDTRQIRIHAIGTVIQELDARNRPKSRLDGINMHFFDFFAGNNTQICFCLQDRLRYTIRRDDHRS